MIYAAILGNHKKIIQAVVDILFYKVLYSLFKIENFC